MVTIYKTPITCITHMGSLTMCKTHQVCICVYHVSWTLLFQEYLVLCTKYFVSNSIYSHFSVDGFHEQQSKKIMDYTIVPGPLTKYLLRRMWSEIFDRTIWRESGTKILFHQTIKLIVYCDYLCTIFLNHINYISHDLILHSNNPFPSV